MANSCHIKYPHCHKSSKLGEEVELKVICVGHTLNYSPSKVVRVPLPATADKVMTDCNRL